MQNLLMLLSTITYWLAFGPKCTKSELNRLKWTEMLRSGAEPRCPLGGPWPLQKKKKSPPTYRQILIGPTNDVHLAPSPISVQYFNSLPNSSFKCRPFYSLIKQNMAYSPLIFKYPKHYPTKQHFITHFPTQNQKI